jgi:hypothetical protein
MATTMLCVAIVLGVASLSITDKALSTSTFSRSGTGLLTICIDVTHAILIKAHICLHTLQAVSMIAFIAVA